MSSECTRNPSFCDYEREVKNHFETGVNAHVNAGLKTPNVIAIGWEEKKDVVDRRVSSANACKTDQYERINQKNLY